MAQDRLDNVVLLGAGVLGGQIAWQSAFKGKAVVVYDLREEGLEQCRADQQRYADIYMRDLGATESMMADTRARLSFTTDLAAAVAEADLVIEAVPEVPDIKIALYQELAGYLPEHTLIATNSSTLLPSQFAEATGRPEKYCALHFANLIWALNVAEIMAHANTSEETLRAVTRFAIEIGMVPIPVQKEQSGYVLNSMLVPLVTAAMTLVVNGVSTPETIDQTFMINHRGCKAGPCGIIDFVGMTTAYNITSYWGNQNNDEQMLRNARYIKEHFLDKGKLGVQTGEGFYKYPNPSYAAADFLDVPDITKADELAKLALPKK
jgi:3-hydroxybutyryl-CoA dehydrogenase